MADHEHNEYATVRDLNGFGDRVSRVERSQEGLRVQMERNNKDIQDIFKLSSENTKIVGDLAKNMALLQGKIIGAVAVVVTVISAIFHFIK